MAVDKNWIAHRTRVVIFIAVRLDGTTTNCSDPWHRTAHPNPISLGLVPPPLRPQPPLPSTVATLPWRDTPTRGFVVEDFAVEGGGVVIEGWRGILGIG